MLLILGNKKCATLRELYDRASSDQRVLLMDKHDFISGLMNLDQIKPGAYAGNWNLEGRIVRSEEISMVIHNLSFLSEADLQSVNTTDRSYAKTEYAAWIYGLLNMLSNVANRPRVSGNLAPLFSLVEFWQHARRLGVATPDWYFGREPEQQDDCISIGNIFNKSVWKQSPVKHPAKPVSIARLHYRRPEGQPIIAHIAFGKVFCVSPSVNDLPLTEIAGFFGLDIASILIFRCQHSGKMTLAAMDAFYDRKNLCRSYERQFLSAVINGPAVERVIH